MNNISAEDILINLQNEMKKSKTNFLYSTIFLKREKRLALNCVYAFCRKSDDIVDDETSTPEEKLIRLDEWKEEFTNSINGNIRNNYFIALNFVINKYKIPVSAFLDLLKGMELDISGKKYQTFEDLYQYCYYAASTVGLMSIPIFGYKNSDTVDFAVNLGIAMQLTNILRDVAKDAKNGRIYLPLEDMEKFQYTEKDILNNNYNDNFRQLMKYQCKRAEEYYKRADKFLAVEDSRNMITAKIMEIIYHNLLYRIEKLEYNVYGNTIRIPKVKKLFLAYGIYLKNKLSL